MSKNGQAIVSVLSVVKKPGDNTEIQVVFQNSQFPELTDTKRIKL